LRKCLKENESPELKEWKDEKVEDIFQTPPNTDRMVENRQTFGR